MKKHLMNVMLCMTLLVGGCGGGESCVVAWVAIACDDELAWLVPGWEVAGLEVVGGH